MLILFDADGTLIDRDTGQFLPGVLARIASIRRRRPGVKFAVVTNQGGVGLRYWMESGGFGDPSRYPTPSSAARRYGRVARAIGARLYICYAYRARSGQWAPTPPFTQHPERWDHSCRKPAPGMLLMAMRDAGETDARRVLMVGDRAEDEMAARNAGVRFAVALDFFQNSGRKK